MEAKQDNTSLIECIQSLMGLVDTPMGRRYFSGEIGKAIVEDARKVLRDHVK